jgi:glycosyltransferase involved in cell wall biosynthesis
MASTTPLLKTAPPMRIGIITGEYPPMQGGIGAYTRILAGELAAQGHAVFVYSRRSARSENPAIHLTPVVGRWGLGSLIGAASWARDNQLDIVNIQYQTAAFDMSPYIHFLPDALRPIPAVTTFHDLRYPYLFPKAGLLRERIVARLARASKGVIATNAEDAERLPPVRGALIPIGSNIARDAGANRESWRESAGAKPGDFLIVYFGLVNRSKGLDTLLDAAAQLRDLPLRLALVGAVAGSSDPTNAAYLREIDAQIERLGLAPLIHRTGYLDDAAVSGYLSAADTVALPFTDGASYRRGTLMAALQHGCAIVTTAPQAAVPAFREGENLCLVPPGDPAALAAALRRLHNTPDERARLQHGAAELATQFEWPQIARTTANFFARLLGARA